MPKSGRGIALVLLLLIALSLWPGTIQAQEPLRVAISTIRAEDFPHVKAYITVTDAGGKIIRGLDKAAFSLLEDGRNISVDDVKVADPDELTLAVALVIDASGSMKGEPLEEAKAAAISFTESLGDNDLAAIVVFSDTAKVTQDFTSDKLLLKNAINSILPGSYTCLFDGTYYAVKETALQQTDRRAVVVMTDGAECGNESCTLPCSIFGEDDCILRAKENNIPVHMIGFRSNVQERPLIRIAESTGGTYRRADAGGLDKVYQEIADDLKYAYVVSFESHLPHDQQGHSLTANVTVASSTGHDLQTFPARRELDPPVLRVSGYEEGKEYNEPVDLTAEVISRNPVDRVVYQVNGAGVYTATATPWKYTWNPKKADEVENQFSVIAYDNTGAASDPVLFTLKTPPPAEDGEPDEDEEEKTNLLLYILGGVAVLLIGGGIFALTRIKRQSHTCPNCNRVLPADMTECPFCARDAMGKTPATPQDSGSMSWGGVEPSTMGEGVPAIPPGGGVPGIPMTQQYQGVAGQPPRQEKTVIMSVRPKVSAWLAVERGEHQGHIFRLEQEELRIGRDPGQNDVVLTDQTASGQHAKLRIVDKEVVLFDLASTNGTLVNGEKILKHSLADGDRITIGNTTFVFKRAEVGG